MTAETRAADWRAANERYLASWLAVALADDAGGCGGGASPAELGRDIEHRFEVVPALDALCDAFSLNDAERCALVLLAGQEIAPGAPDGGGLDDRRPLMGAAPSARLQPAALSPAGALRRWRLVEHHRGAGPGEDRWRLDERVLDYLRGFSYLEPRLDGIVRAGAGVGIALAPCHEAQAAALARTLLSGSSAERAPCVQITGTDAPTRRSIARAACERIAAGLYTIAAADIPAFGAEQAALARLWEREAVLLKAALLVELDGGSEAEPVRERAARFAAMVQGVVFLSGPDPIPCRDRPAVMRVEVARPELAEQRAMWRRALGPLAGPCDGALDAVITQFQLGPEGIAAVAEGMTRSAGSGDHDAAERLWELCRAEARVPLDALAQRLDTRATWDDLVLPAAQRATLRQIAAQVRHRFTVYDRWGFAARDRRGLGITALFAGPSGTGKTLAAEVLAGELRLDLYRIDLSAVVSKYIGETEKNLRRLFEAAEASGAVLLFDEADALFGRRSEVKDSHDRYANIEVSYLLQRMESYRGLAILTTNMKDALDRAFLRRLRFVVHFPFPDAAQRAEIWRRVLPATLDAGGLDFDRLARLQVTGGGIRNIAVNAAFIAADAGEALGMGQVLQAARSEYAKMERPLSGAETEGWA